MNAWEQYKKSREQSFDGARAWEAAKAKRDVSALNTDTTRSSTAAGASKTGSTTNAGSTTSAGSTSTAGSRNILDILGKKTTSGAVQTSADEQSAFSGDRVIAGGGRTSKTGGTTSAVSRESALSEHKTAVDTMNTAESTLAELRETQKAANMAANPATGEAIAKAAGYASLAELNKAVSDAETALSAATTTRNTAAQNYYEASGSEAVSDVLATGKTSAFNDAVAAAAEVLGLYDTYRYGGWTNDVTSALTAALEKKDKAVASLVAAGANKDEVIEAVEYAAQQVRAKAAEAKNESTRKWADENPVAAAALSVATSPAQGLDYLSAMLGNLGHNSADNAESYTPLSAADFSITGQTQALRGGASADMGAVGQFLFNTGMSIADSTLLVATLGPGATAVMGMGAASNTAKDVIDRGGTSEQALTAGLAAGAAEMFFEKFSVDELLSMTNVTSVKTALVNMLKQAGVEASEEFNTEIASILMDSIIMGENSNFNTAVRHYVAQGMSEDAAKKQAFLDNLTQVGLAGLGGALSGGVMGGAASTGSYLTTNGGQYTADTQDGGAVALETATPYPEEVEQGGIQEGSGEIVQSAKKLPGETEKRGGSEEHLNPATEVETGAQKGVSAEKEAPETTNAQRAVSKPSVASEGGELRVAEKNVEALVADSTGSGTLDDDTTNTEVKDDGGEEVFVYEGGQRADGESSGGEDRGLAGETETAPRENDDGEPADSGADSLLYGRRVSATSLGIEGGSDTRNLRIVRGGDSEFTKAARQIAEENGLALTLFGDGNLKLTDKNGAEYEVRALVEDVSLRDSVLAAKGSPLRGKTARAFVRADHPLFTAEQLTKHEVGHRMIAQREINPDTVRARMADTFGSERVEQLAQMYAEAYEGSGLTPAQIWNEVICDSIADMNIFSTKADAAPAAKRTEVEMTTEGETVNETPAPAPETTGEASRETKFVSVTEDQSADLSATREAIRDTVREELDRLGKEYGWIKAGESPARAVELPKQTSDDKKVSQAIRTVMEAQATPDEVLPTLESMVASGEFSYEVYGDEAAVNDANEYITNLGTSDALREWFKAMERGEVSKRNTAVGWALYNNAVNSGDTETALSILNAMVEHQRNAAQALQATRVLKKLSPETQLYVVQKSIARLQQEVNDRNGSKKKGATPIAIDPKLAEQVLNAPDQKARDEAMKQIYRNVGKQLPSSFVDKWTAWRYLAMLGNPRTWGRNIIGNAMFAPVVATKNLTATAIESAVSRVSGGNTARSKSLVTGATESDRALLSAAWGDYANVEDAVMGVGKYSDSVLANKQIEEGRQIFGRVEQAKTGVGRVVSGTLGKAVEAARKGTAKVMDVGDQWFSKPHYASALASYCKANGITAEQIQKGEGLDEARTYAIKESQKATYRDVNAFSEAISQLGRYKGNNPFRKGLSVALEGILPFRKTPANILARGVEYSPAGIVKALSYDLYKVKQGDMTAAELIDDLSAGLTGTGLMGLGVFLASQGLVRGHGGGDEIEKEFEELMGHQAYALEVGDTSITLDWLAPEVLPFFVGVNLWEATEGGEKPATMADVLSAVGLVTEPLLEMSCLQSLNDVFEAVQYAEENGTDYLTAALASAATSYLTQAIPVLSGQLERSAQGERVTTYTTKGNKNLTTDMQYTVGNASSKLPGWDFQQIPYIDAWGRTENSGDVGERLFNNMLNPAYVSEIETSEMEAELERLYDETGEKSVFPSRADKYLTVGGERVDLDADQYVKYAETKGQTAYDLLSELTASERYSTLSDADRVEVIGWAYDYANALAKTAVSDYALSGWVEKAERAAANGVSVVEYILYKQAVVAVSTDGNTNTSQAEAEAALRGMADLTDEQRALLWQSTNSSWKADNNPFK